MEINFRIIPQKRQCYGQTAISRQSFNDKNTCAVLNSDPTSKTHRKLNKMLLDLKKLVGLVTLRTKCYTVVTAYVHVFMAYLKL